MENNLNPGLKICIDCRKRLFAKPPQDGTEIDNTTQTDKLNTSLTNLNVLKKLTKLIKNVLNLLTLNSERKKLLLTFRPEI